jgi:phosphatidylserine/phosphatidylglycerophosphate/cardiolipin synthase-like enzyme
MVIDEQIVVAGSFNYTRPANEYNDENIFVMGSTHAEVEGVEVEASASRQLAVYLKQEIERIISLSKRYDPAA